MTLVQKLVTNDSFDARGVLVKAGHIGVFDSDKITGDEQNLKDVGDFEPARVEITAIAPTGPNPQMPQQLPPDAVQTAEGYVIPGKVLVGEVTSPVEDRIEALGLRDPNIEAKVDETLDAIMGGPGSTTGNADDALVAGTVKEVTADLGTKTDEQLEQLKAAENDREKPRTGVISAIDEELAARAAAKEPQPA